MALVVATTILFPLATAYQEIELQAATDALSADGFATVDHVFWRSSFGAPMVGGPTFAGGAGAFNNFTLQAEAWSGGTVPTGALPVFLEYASLASPAYASGNGSDTDYSTQRWTFAAGDHKAGAASLGAGAAADAAWAEELLRTNHDANGTQSPTGPLVGASNDAGLLGIFLVQGLSDRILAVMGGAAYNGSALQGFNLTDAALTDDNPANGWQLVPDALAVSLNGSNFQGFAPSANTSSLRGQAALILGLAEVVRLSDPAGDWGGLFDGSPFDSTLYDNARALLGAVASNAQAYHWSAAASTYTEPDKSSVDTGDLALFARALSVAESAASSDAALQATLGGLRAKATAALASQAGVGGRYAASYTVNGSTVTPDFANISLWAQGEAVEAWSASFGATGLKADYDAAMRASAGLESGLYRNGSYAAVSPEGTATTYRGAAVAAAVGALRDLSLTGDEPLAVWRLVDAYDTLVDAPPLTLSGAQEPPVVGASFAYNVTSSTASAATGFSAFDALLAAYEFASTGARYNAAVGGGVFVTESSSVLLHNATATQVGTAVDGLDQQLADLQSQLSSLQAAFDAINSTASQIEERLNLSLENESISQARIQDLIDNVTALRTALNESQSTRDNATALYANISQMLNDSQLEVANLTYSLAQEQNATSDALGQLNVAKEDLKAANESVDTMNGKLDEATNQRNSAQALAAGGVLAGIIAGFVLFYVINRFVMVKPLGSGAKGKPSKDEEDEDEDDGEDED